MTLIQGWRHRSGDRIRTRRGLSVGKRCSAEELLCTAGKQLLAADQRCSGGRRMPKLLQQVVLGLLAVITWAVPAFAAERMVAAIVDRVSGENITYREKDGAEQPLRLLTQLHTGDFVYLPESADVIELLV